MTKKLFLLFALALISAGAFSQDHTAQLHELKTYYENARQDWEVPGLAVAIVKDGEIIFSEGFGVRNIETGDRVTGQTLFPIASNTKAFTAATLAILVDEGKISWDDKVTQYIPWFKLYNPYVTENMTIRDLLTHRSGLATFSGDLLWYGTDYSREEIIRRARHLKPAFGFREQFGYSNILYLTAGEIVPAVTNMSWDNFVEQKIFDPLNMERSITTTGKLDQFDNVATPHTGYQGEVIPIEYLNWDNIAPAGSIISCVDDVSQWLIMQLNRGIYEGDTIFSSRRSREMWSPNTILGVSEYSERQWPSMFFRSYGLGWSLSNYLGRKVIGHSGGYDGMISYTCLVPEEDLGFVILTNKNSSLYYPLVYKTLDVFLGGEERDWSAFMLEMYRQQDSIAAVERKENEAARVKGTSPTLPLEAYTGTYGGQLYGNATVTLEEGQLKLRMLPAEKFQGPLTHWHFNTFEITFPEFPSLPAGTVTFVIDAEGKVEEMKIDVPNPDFDFTELTFMKMDQ
ncbi:MAG: serine hydrolase [Bacteroidales bacterium]